MHYFFTFVILSPFKCNLQSDASGFFFVYITCMKKKKQDASGTLLSLNTGT